MEEGKIGIWGPFTEYVMQGREHHASDSQKRDHGLE